MADTKDLKSFARKSVRVQVPPWVPIYRLIAQWLEQGAHNALVGGSNPSGPKFLNTQMKIEPIQNTFLQSQNSSYDERWRRYLKNEEYLPKKKEEPEEKDLKESQDPHIIGYA